MAGVTRLPRASGVSGRLVGGGVSDGDAPGLTPAETAEGRRRLAVEPEPLGREKDDEHHAGERREAPAIDPLELSLSVPSALSPPPSLPEAAQAGPAWIEPMVSEVIRSLAWGGDRRRGAARLAVGGRQFGGTNIVVHAEGNEVSLELAAPAGVDAAELAERLRERLERRGLVVREVTIV